MAVLMVQSLSRKGGRWRLIGAVWCALCLWVATPNFAADETGVSKEFQVKAVFLYNFAQFVEWPANAFTAPDSPLVIGVLGLDPFGVFLDETVRNEKVNGRPLVVERYRSASEIGSCHILFISGSEGPRASQVAAALKGRSVLTVCDWEGFVRHGAMVRFAMERSRVRLKINLDAARAEGLNISSKLLRSAEMVGQAGGEK